MRQDNADERLTELSTTIGLAERQRVELLKEKRKMTAKYVDFLKNHSISPDEINNFSGFGYRNIKFI